MPEDPKGNWYLRGESGDRPASEDIKYLCRERSSLSRLTGRRKDMKMSRGCWDVSNEAKGT